MSWDNYGEWHLDHVKPCASFDLSNQNDVQICFNWKNYQPLWRSDNIIKGNKVDDLLIETHKQKAYEFETTYLSAQVKGGELRELPKVSSTNLS